MEHGVNHYERKQEARRQRLLERAKRREAESSRRMAAFKRESDGIPMGQPILVGHYSEGRHRRAIDRMDRNLKRAHDAGVEARDLRTRAAAVGSGGISSDDPDAIVKLRAKLQEMETSHAAMKDVNATFRKGGWEAVEAKFGTVLAACRKARMAEWEKVPYPPYALSNSSANMRRVKDRIAALEREVAARDDGDALVVIFEAADMTIEEDRDDNRLRIIFASKPDRDTIGSLKASGFRWARSLGVWQRQLNNAARQSASRVVRAYAGDEASKLYEETIR